ncbi:MAG: DUF455 family protein [Acidobacteriota bacterium]
MEVRELALRVVTSPSLDDKLRPERLERLTDRTPGPALRLDAPAREPQLRIVSTRDARIKVPSPQGMGDPAQRRRILNALANHELQAAELFAWALLAFPDADPEFRRGLLEILDDEQRHTRMYIARLEAHGARFGDWPVTGYFWNKIDGLTSPLAFACTMGLTFENANLDHTREYAEYARSGGDLKTAAVIDRVHLDERRHVRFGWTWLLRLKAADQEPWDAYRQALGWPLRPSKARGARFERAAREAAGLDDDFIRRLEASTPELDRGAARRACAD